MRSSYQGFTLVEVLLSIALGAAIVLATTELLLEGRGSLQYQSQWRELHERGRHLMQFLSTELRKAGYPRVGYSGTALSGSDGSGSTPDDSVTIGYQGGQDCAGSAATTIRYYLDGSDLRCDGNGGASPTPQTLSSHIDGLQLRYGADSDGDGSIERYHAASAITDWGTIKSVTIAVLLRSEHAVRQQADQEHYTLLGVEHGPYEDYYLRRVYQLTVQLRNH
jgi:prepilin-type N-terminal cleavage/methylation domain-containing protein